MERITSGVLKLIINIFMATYGNGIMRPFNGEVGTVVGYMWDGEACMRAYRQHVANPPPAAQEWHGVQFREGVQLAARMGWTVTTTLTEAGRAAGASGYRWVVIGY